MAKFYCKYCGDAYNSIQQLTRFDCAKHPNGWCKGKHALYEGSEKSKYTCKYCGDAYNSIQQLTKFDCAKHPNGWCKGKHSPAL